MKKVILVLFLAFGLSQTSNAQFNFGIKGGINYNSNSVDGVTDAGQDIFGGAKSKTGYHIGVWTRLKVPVLGLYVRPELIYTNLENEIEYNQAAKVTTHTFQKIDIPVLLGKKIFGIGNALIGPSFQYVLDSDFEIDDISSVDANGFTMGLVFGGGVEFGKLGIDVRWERGFSSIESSFVGNLGSVSYDTRVNQIIIGLSIEL
jgi:hypothetical protein